MRHSYVLESEKFGPVSVSVLEVMRAMRQEGNKFDGGTFFGAGFPAIAELLHQYHLRGGPLAPTPETVRETFERTRIGKVTLSGGTSGSEYQVDLSAGRVTELRPTAVTSPWPMPREQTQGVERRGYTARRLVSERRGNYDKSPWRHSCRVTLPRQFRIMETNFCPHCGAVRGVAYDRRRVGHRRNPFDNGRRQGE